jgi:hypothetical protein
MQMENAGGDEEKACRGQVKALIRKIKCHQRRRIFMVNRP